LKKCVFTRCWVALRIEGVRAVPVPISDPDLAALMMHFFLEYYSRTQAPCPSVHVTFGSQPCFLSDFPAKEVTFQSAPLAPGQLF
jgi:hypothetical protein